MAMDGSSAASFASGKAEAHESLIRAVVTWGRWRFAPDVRDDVAQKIRLELLRHPEAIANAANSISLVKQICIRRCIDEVRRQIRERRVWAEEAGDDIAGDDADINPRRLVERAERARVMRRLVEALDETCRIAICLFYVEEFSYREMADRLGIAINTVGSRLAKCLAKLRDDARGDPEFREYFRR